MGAELLDRAYEATGAVLAGVTRDQLDRPTPCASWKVRDLLNHLIAGGYFCAAVASGEEPTPRAERPDYSAGDFHASFADGSARARAAFHEDGAMDRVMKPPFGEVPGSVFVMIAAADVYAHGWDLAAALGDTTGLDQELAAVSIEPVRRFLPAEGRDSERIPFGPVVPVGEDAPAYDRLLGWYGRDPRWSGR